MGGQGAKAKGIGWSETIAPTIKSVMSGGNTVPDVVYAIDQQGGKGTANCAENVMPTLCSDSHGTPHGVAYAIEGNTIDRASNKNGKGYCENVTPTLNTVDRHGIAIRGFDMQAFGKYSERGTSSTLKQRDYKDATDLVVEHDKRYIVRRLTPLECCRLQGYPDGWTENLSIPDPTDEELSFFTKVWADWSAINGNKPKPTAWVRKWLADPQSDSAEYKAYGNSLAIPCAYDVIRRVVDFCDREKSEAGH